MYSKLYSICLCLILFIIYIFLDKQKNYERLQNYTDDISDSNSGEDISNCLRYTKMYDNLTKEDHDELNSYLDETAYTKNYFKVNFSDISDVALDFAYFNNSANIQAGYNLYQ